jgi:hypothetical protein
MLSVGDAMSLYRDKYEGDDVAPKFLHWWYWHETRHPDGIAMMPNQPNYLRFHEWKTLRSIPDIDCPLN